MIRTLSAVLAVLAPFTADAADLHVGSGQSYQTVQAAVDAGADFDTIVVHAGTYVGTVTVPTRYSHLSIKAYGTDTVVLRGQGSNATLTSNATALRVQGLTLEASQGDNRRVVAVNSGSRSTGYTTTIFCDTELLGNTTNTDVGVSAQANSLVPQAAVFYSETLTGLNAISAGPLTSIWEDDMPLGIWEDDMPLGIWEDDMPLGIWEDDMPLGLCQF